MRIGSLLFFLTTALTVVLTMSACGMRKKIYGGSEEPETYQKIAASLMSSESLLLEIDPSSAVTTGADITKISNLKATNSFPLGTLDLTPDTTLIANLSNGWMFFWPPSQGKRFRTPQGLPLDSSEVSLLAVVKTSSRGKILTFDPSDIETESFSIELSNSQVIAKFNSSSTSFFASTLALPTSENMIVAISFGASADDLVFSVNGLLAGQAAITGAGQGPLSLERLLSIGPLETSQTLTLKNLLLFNRALTKKELGSLISYLSSKEGIGIELDPSLQIDPPVNDPLFDEVRHVLTMNCISCHSSWNGASASYFVSQNLVKRQSPETSPLYYRLRDSTGSSGPKTMPPSGSLSESDRNTIKSWINSL